MQNKYVFFFVNNTKDLILDTYLTLTKTAKNIELENDDLLRSDITDMFNEGRPIRTKIVLNPGQRIEKPIIFEDDHVLDYVMMSKVYKDG